MDAIKVGSMQPGMMNISAALQFVLEKLQGINEAKAWFPPFPDMPGIPGGAPMMPGLPGGPPPGGAPPPGMGPLGPEAGHTPPNKVPAQNPTPSTTMAAPGMKSGPRGNQPSFLPRPIRRQPVAP